MSRALDEAMEAIDAGLQHSDEWGEPVGIGCVRCSSDRLAEGSDLCEQCRAYLLGDSEHDPAAYAADELESLPDLAALDGLTPADVVLGHGFLEHRLPEHGSLDTGASVRSEEGATSSGSEPLTSTGPR